jgi:hypothetical protein
MLCLGRCHDYGNGKSTRVPQSSLLLPACSHAQTFSDNSKVYRCQEPSNGVAIAALFIDRPHSASVFEDVRHSCRLSGDRVTSLRPCRLADRPSFSDLVFRCSGVVATAFRDGNNTPYLRHCGTLHTSLLRALRRSRGEVSILKRFVTGSLSLTTHHNKSSIPGASTGVLPIQLPGPGQGRQFLGQE